MEKVQNCVFVPDEPHSSQCILCPKFTFESLLAIVMNKWEVSCHGFGFLLLWLMNWKQVQSIGNCDSFPWLRFRDIKLYVDFLEEVDNTILLHVIIIMYKKWEAYIVWGEKPRPTLHREVKVALPHMNFGATAAPVHSSRFLKVYNLNWSFWGMMPISYTVFIPCESGGKSLEWDSWD